MEPIKQKKIDIRSLNRHDRRRVRAIHGIKIPGINKPILRKCGCGYNEKGELSSLCKAHMIKPKCCRECSRHDNFCIPSCYPEHCHNQSCPCHK